MKERNCSIDIFRLIAALLIVICHVHMFHEVNESLYMAVSQQFPRFCVAFFFGVAGYYYIGALLKGKAVFVKQMKGLMYVYITWTLIYYLASFGINVVMNGEPLGEFLIQRVIYFFLEGGYSHMWYMVALIYATLIITLAHKLAGEKGIKFVAAFGVVAMIFCWFGSSFYVFGSKIPVLKVVYDSEPFIYMKRWLGMGLAYVSLGYYVIKLEERKKKLSDRTVGILLGVSWALFIIEILAFVFVIKNYERRQLVGSIYMLTIANLLFLLRHPLPKHMDTAKICKELSSFIYFAHPLIIVVVQTLAGMLGYEINSILLYFIVIAINCIIGYILVKSNWKVKKYLM